MAAPGPEFAAAIAELVEDAGERERLRRRARAFARGLPTWQQAADVLAGCHRELVEASPRIRRAA